MSEGEGKLDLATILKLIKTARQENIWDGFIHNEANPFYQLVQHVKDADKQKPPSDDQSQGG